MDLKKNERIIYEKRKTKQNNFRAYGTCNGCPSYDRMWRKKYRKRRRRDAHGIFMEYEFI